MLAFAFSGPALAEENKAYGPLQELVNYQCKQGCPPNEPNCRTQVLKYTPQGQSAERCIDARCVPNSEGKCVNQCLENGSCTICDLIRVPIGIYKFILSSLGVIALLLFVCGGVKLMFSSGDTAKINAAKKTLIGTATGMGVVLFAWLFVNTMLNVLIKGKLYSQEAGKSASMRVFGFGWDDPCSWIRDEQGNEGGVQQANSIILTEIKKMMVASKNITWAQLNVMKLDGGSSLSDLYTPRLNRCNPQDPSCQKLIKTDPAHYQPYQIYHPQYGGAMYLTAGYMEPYGHAEKNYTVQYVTPQGKIATANGNTGMNLGIDYVVQTPGKAVLSWYQGTVVKAGNTESGYGNRIHIKTHHQIDGKDVYIAYAHLASISLFVNTVGANVGAAQQIGVMGATGGDYAEHVDFQIMYFTDNVFSPNNYKTMVQLPANMIPQP